MARHRRPPDWARRRAAEREARREADYQNRVVGPLMGLGEPNDLGDSPDMVGWGVFVPGGSVKGQGHVCKECSRTAPTPQHQTIHRSRLAAREGCTWCGQILETL